ncbi:MAG: PEGA domain-containing protein [Polyangiales bacterium]
MSSTGWSDGRSAWSRCIAAVIVTLGYATQYAAAQPAPAGTPVPAPSAGQPTAAVQATGSTERAREAYALGQKAFSLGDYATAQTAFEEAFANVPNPIVLVSIAESAAKQGRLESAVAAYDKYLQLRPDAPDRADVEQKRNALVATPGVLTITSEPPNANVIVDGQATGKQTPVLLELAPGEHFIELALTGYVADPVTIKVAPGSRAEQAVGLRGSPVPTPPPAAEPVPVPAPAAAVQAKPERPLAAIIVTGSLGAAGIIAGTALGILALSERSDYDKQPTEAGADRGERLALFADVGFGIGAMSLVTTAVLLLTHDDAPAEDKAPQTARMQIIPSVTPRGASATAQLRF